MLGACQPLASDGGSGKTDRARWVAVPAVRWWLPLEIRGPAGWWRSKQSGSVVRSSLVPFRPAHADAELFLQCSSTRDGLGRTLMRVRSLPPPCTVLYCTPALRCDAMPASERRPLLPRASPLRARAVDRPTAAPRRAGERERVAWRPPRLRRLHPSTGARRTATWPLRATRTQPRRPRGRHRMASGGGQTEPVSRGRGEPEETPRRRMGWKRCCQPHPSTPRPRRNFPGQPRTGESVSGR